MRCSLLADTLRQHLPDTGAVDERVIAVGELLGSPLVWLANSLRGLMTARLEKTPRP